MSYADTAHSDTRATLSAYLLIRVSSIYQRTVYFSGQIARMRRLIWSYTIRKWQITVVDFGALGVNICSHGDWENIFADRESVIVYNPLFVKSHGRPT